MRISPDANKRWSFKKIKKDAMCANIVRENKIYAELSPFPGHKKLEKFVSESSEVR